MKIYISADIEGVTGVTHWDDAVKPQADYERYRKQMTLEVNAACEGANDAGANEIWIKDAHADGRNIDGSMLPENTKLIYGWSGHPLSMVQELDSSFDALLMIGYHSRAGSGGNPLSHTMSSSQIQSMKINNQFISEFHLFGYASMAMGVPVVLISGDKQICVDANSFTPGINTVNVKKGVGDSTVSIHPNKAINKIRKSTQKALSLDLSSYSTKVPDNFQLEIQYKHHKNAYKSSFFPGVDLVDPVTCSFQTGDYFELLRMVLFAI